MINKICVYAICKNELNFVQRWLDSMLEADYIVVLDTGSTDGTYEALKNDKRVYAVEQKIINPWRFDVARNESMKLIPKDANILICTDLDEILHKGWAKPLKEKWIDGYHTRGHYKYIWSHSVDGSPGRIFVYDKIHDKNWIWKHPVHELLYDSSNREQHYLNLWDDVTLEHFPDITKSRSSYLPLLELRAKESPDDYYGLFYLSHEYYYQKLFDKSIDLLNKIIDEYKEHYNNVELAAAYLFLGDNYRNKGEKVKAIYYYNEGIQIDPTYRECYLNAAEIYNELKMYDAAVAYVDMALKKSYRHYTWVERDNSYREQPYDILSIALYYIAMDSKEREKLEKSKEYIDKALSYNPTDKRLNYNKTFIINALNGKESI